MIPHRIFDTTRGTSIPAYSLIKLVKASPQTPFCIPNQPIRLIAKIKLTIYRPPLSPKVDFVSVHDAIPKSQPIIPKIDMTTTTITYPNVPEIIAGHTGIASANNAPSKNEGTHTQIPACTKAIEIQLFRSFFPMGVSALASALFFFSIFPSFSMQ